MPWKNPIDEAWERVEKTLDELRALLPWALADTVLGVLVWQLWGITAVYGWLLGGLMNMTFSAWKDRPDSEKTEETKP